MNNKGFTDTDAVIETPNDVSNAEKPLKPKKKTICFNYSKF